MKTLTGGLIAKISGPGKMQTESFAALCEKMESDGNTAGWHTAQLESAAGMRGKPNIFNVL